MSDNRLSNLTNLLAPQGVVGVSVPDWNNKNTWTFWKAGSSELNCLADPGVAPLVQGFDITLLPDDPLDVWDLITLKIAFNHENRIRALEARPAITLTQFKTAVKALL